MKTEGHLFVLYRNFRPLSIVVFHEHKNGKNRARLSVTLNARDKFNTATLVKACIKLISNFGLIMLHQLVDMGSKSFVSLVLRKSCIHSNEGLPIPCLKIYLDTV